MPDDVYTHGHHRSVLRSHTWRDAENSCGYLLPHLRSGQRLLDVGCGPGTITVDLASRVAPGQVVGIDRSEEIVAAATTAASAPDGLRFDVGDVYELSFDDRSFDVVHAHQVLQHLSDPVAALREMLRVTDRDGLVAVRDADYGAMTWYPELPALDHWLGTYRAVARRNRAEPDAGRVVAAWARRAGAAQVHASASTWLFTTDEERAWWGGLWADRVTDSAFGRQAVGEGLATVDDTRRWADAWREWAADPDGWFVVLNGEAILRP